MNSLENQSSYTFIQRHFFSFYFAGYLIFALIIWIGISQDFANSPGALYFVSIVADYVPMLHSIEKIPGSNPKVRFFYAALWSLIPLLIFCPWVLPMDKRISKEQRDTLPTARAFWYGIALFGTCLLMTLVWPINPGSVSRRDAVLTGDFFGTVFFGFIASSSALLFGMSLWGLFALMKLRIQNSNVIKRDSTNG